VSLIFAICYFTVISCLKPIPILKARAFEAILIFFKKSHIIAVVFVKITLSKAYN